MTDPSGKHFDPTRHLRKLGKQGDYLEVKWRLVWLRTEHPDAVIRTECVQLDRDAAFALFRATVSIPQGGEATGYGSETAKDFGDFIEKAETKAIGRALGALGYGTQFADDFDYEKPTPQTRIVDSPVQRPQTAAAPAPTQTPALQQQATGGPPPPRPDAVHQGTREGVDVWQVGLLSGFLTTKAGSPMLQSYLRCPSHDVPYLCLLTGASAWRHRLPDGGICAYQPAGQGGK